MAKLSKGNLAAKKDAPISKVDDWNPPIVPSFVAAQMLPPKSRPLPRVPTTPAGESQTKSANSELQTSSSRKKRRRRGGKRNGDSASEVTTNISEDTSHSVTMSTHNSSNVPVPAPRSSLSQLPSDASAEQIRIFENEPELFGVFASSDEEDEEEGKKPIKNLPRQTRLQTYSPSIVAGFAESSPVRGRRGTSIASSRAEPTRPQIGSDVVPPGMVRVPDAKQLSDGRFRCPLRLQYDCTKTFKNPSSAKRHGESHVNADRFKCEKCDKGFSRQDLLVRHVKIHDKQDGTAKQNEATRGDDMHEIQLNGLVEIKKAEEDEMTAIVSNADLDYAADTTDDEEILQIEVEDSMEDASATDVSEVAQAEIDDEEQLTPNHDLQDYSSQLNEGERNGTKEEHIAGQSNAEDIPTSPTERTVFSSSERSSPPAEQQSPVANGRMKRKRPSPRSSPEFEIPPSRKRMRRDREEKLPSSPSSRQIGLTEKNSTSTRPVKSSELVESRASQDMKVKVSVRDDGIRKGRPESEEATESDSDPAPDTDVEMEDDQVVQESDHEDTSGLMNQMGRSPPPIMDNTETNDNEPSALTEMDGETTDSDSMETEEAGAGEQQQEDEKEEEEKVRTHSDDDVESEPPQSRENASEEPLPTRHRQTSMDSFAQPLMSTAASTKASASRLRISVNVPVRFKTHSKKAQSKLSPEGPVGPQRPTKIIDIPPAEDLEENELDQNDRLKANSKRKSRALSKGKRKARADVDSRVDSKEPEEKTSSEDRPKATTVARRTSSLGSKSRPQLKSRAIPNKRAQPTSDSDVSEPMKRPKSRLKRPSKKKQQAPAAEESEESEKAERKRPVSTAKATWAEASKSGATGKFTEDEMQTLNSWRDSFCEENNLTAYEFNEMMENSASVSKTDWRYGWITKPEFMQQYYEQLPNRNRRSMLRLRERQFSNAEATPWTEDHDKELRQLVTELGSKWVEIAQIMGRTQDAVNQRWRHKLNYGEKPALMGDWTTEEVKKLEDEVTAFAQMKNTTADDEDLQIPWNAISKKMGTGRTAQQCSNRWRINTSRRVNGKFVKVPHSDRLPGTKVKKPRTPSKMEKRLSGQGTERPGKAYKSAEKVEDSDGEEEEEGGGGGGGGGQGEEEEEEDGDENEDEEGEGEEVEEEEEEEEKEDEQEEDEHADDKSNKSLSDEEPDMDDEQEDVNENVTNSQTNLDDEDEQQTSKEDSGSDSEDVEMTSESGQARSPSEDSARKSTSVPTQPSGSSSKTTKSSPTKRYTLSQHGSSSQPTPKTSQHISHSQTPSTQLHSLSSSQPPTIFKTPAISRNPLKRSSRSRSSPSLDLSLSQIYAGTQANSSAKRTPGRATRTRIPDSVIPENRPSPGLSVRRRPVRSSSPMMSPLLELSRSAGTGNEDEEEDESDDQNSESGHLELDFKSPTSFVSARDTAGPFDSDEDEEQDDVENQQSDTDGESESDSDSTSSSDTSSNSDAESSSAASNSNQPSQPERQDSGSTFWQSVNQSWRKLAGLSQDGSRQGSGSGSGPSQNQSQTQIQNQKRSRLSLADALRGGSAEEEEEESDDD